MFFSVLIPISNASAQEIVKSKEVGSNIIELPSEKSFVKNWKVVDEFNSTHYLSMDYNEMEMTVDGETFQFDIKEAATSIDRSDDITAEIRPNAVVNPNAGPTIDYSTAATVTGKVPWKGSAILLSAAIAALISGGAAAGWAATIAGAITADAENIYFRYTQYQSVERYWSSYYSIYYHKGINRNITFRQSSSTGKILCGPVNGSWFDPIRPY